VSEHAPSALSATYAELRRFVIAVDEAEQPERLMTACSA
jgi:hypothetical protein